MLACIVAPIVAALYEGATSEMAAAETSGLAAALDAPRGLEATLSFKAVGLVARAQGVAATLAGDASRRKVDPATLQASSGGFVWVVNSDGSVGALAGGLGRQGRSILGHPIFADTQRGFALDGLWAEGGRLYMVGASPIVDGSATSGAVLVGEAIDATFVQGLAKGTGFDVTLVVEGAVVASSLSDKLAKTLSEKTAGRDEPVLAGALEKPISEGTLPLFVDHFADGAAFASVSKAVTSLDAVRWIASVPVTKRLTDLAEQQTRLLKLLGLAVFVSLLVGLTLFKDFVRPLGQLVQHLSGLQQGKGELELPERQVAKPYRRLVKLVNWTVQRSPATSYADSAEIKVKRPAAAHHSEPAPALTGSDFSARTPPPASSKADRALTPPPPNSPPIEGVPEQGTDELLSAFPGDLADPKSDIDSAAAAAIASLTEKKPPKRSANEIRGASPDQLKNASDIRGGTPAPPNEIRGAPANEIRGAPVNEIRAPASEIRGAPANEIRGAPANAIRGAELPGAPLSRGGPTGDLPAVSLPDLGDLASNFPMMRGSFPQSAPFPGNAGSLPISDDAFAGLVQGIGEMPDPEVPAVKMGGSAMMGGSAAGDLGFGIAGLQEEDPGGFRSEATAVGAPSRELIDQSRELGQAFANLGGSLSPDRTAIAQVPKDLLAQSSIDDSDDFEEDAHFRETYQRFLEMRKICGESVDDLGYDKFLVKLQKNKSELQKKYNCKTVRFQVYQKNGKAALKATPIRS
ncbi:MAG: hypothetical protein HYV07_15670 [Deltaproteobacteria bacterium]|nr:hypothetical protein [Deltaproteobacteria bacterium]